MVTRCKTPACLEENGGETTKSKVSLGGLPCDIVVYPGGEPETMWCPEKRRTAQVQAQYPDEIFTYVEAALVPCYVYAEEMKNNGRECASEADIKRLFCVTEEHCTEAKYSTLGVYFFNRQSLQLIEWEGPL